MTQETINEVLKFRDDRNWKYLYVCDQNLREYISQYVDTE